MSEEVLLTADDLSCLSAYAQQQYDVPAALETQARLERLGFVMRGWGHSFVLTEAGREVLRRAGLPGGEGV
jgi:hypothetical protein